MVATSRVTKTDSSSVFVFLRFVFLRRNRATGALVQCHMKKNGFTTLVALTVIGACSGKSSKPTVAASQAPPAAMPSADTLFPALDVHAGVYGYVIHIDENRVVWTCHEQWPCKPGGSVKLGEMNSKGEFRDAHTGAIVIDINSHNQVRINGKISTTQIGPDYVQTRTGRFATLLPNGTVPTRGQMGAVLPETGAPRTALYAIILAGIFAEENVCMIGPCGASQIEFSLPL
jgi:hypothetical protein